MSDAHAMTPAEATRLAARTQSEGRRESNRRAALINDAFFKLRLHTHLHASGTDDADAVAVTLKQPGGGSIEVEVQPIRFAAWLQSNSTFQSIQTAIIKKHESQKNQNRN